MTIIGELPTLQWLENYDTAPLAAGAAQWRATAQAWNDFVTRLARDILRPGGTDWTGAGADAAQGAVDKAQFVVRAEVEKLNTAADTAVFGKDQLDGLHRKTMAFIRDARDDDFLVGSDLSVTDTRTYSRDDIYAPKQQYMRAQQAESYVEDIQFHAAQLLAMDREYGRRLLAQTEGLDRIQLPELGGGKQGAAGDPAPSGSGGTPIRQWTDKDLYPHDPTAADIHQDLIGDCYLDSAMGAIANANPQWIKDRIRYDATTGNFDVTMWDGHQWKHISVTQDDIRTNIAKSGASWLDNGQPNAALWPSVLESAYARLKAPPGDTMDDALVGVIGHGGYAKDAMEALTGNRGTNIDPQAVWLTNQHIDQDIASALANHQPVTISTATHGDPLARSHVYIVEGITGTGSDAQVTLRNPWENNLGTPVNTPNPLVTVRLGDLIGSGLPTGDLSNPLGTHPSTNVNIGHLG